MFEVQFQTAPDTWTTFAQEIPTYPCAARTLVAMTPLEKGDGVDAPARIHGPALDDDGNPELDERGKVHSRRVVHYVELGGLEEEKHA